MKLLYLSGPGTEHLSVLCLCKKNNERKNISIKILLKNKKKKQTFPDQLFNLPQNFGGHLRKIHVRGLSSFQYKREKSTLQFVRPIIIIIKDRIDLDRLIQNDRMIRIKSLT